MEVIKVDATHQCLLAFVKGAICGEDIPMPNVQVDWTLLLSEARDGKILSLVTYALGKLPENMQPENMDELLEELKIRKKRRLKEYTRLQRIIDQAEDRNVQVAVFKGPVFAELYPSSELRYYQDFDFLVAAEEEAMLIEILENMEFKMQPHESKKFVKCFYGPEQMEVEVYTKLWENVTKKQDQCLEEFGLDCEEAFVSMNACGAPITTLGYEEHLLYQLHHISKQMLFAGTELRHLVDLTLYVNSNIEKLNIELVWERLDRLGYGVFANVICQICCRYLGMNLGFLRENQWEEQKSDAWITDFFRLGLMGINRNTTRVAAALVYQTQNKQEKEKKKRDWIRVTLIPGPKELSKRYSYAKKYHILLPLAWGHRMLRYLGYLIKRRRREDVVEPLKQAEKRIRILRQLELLEQQGM